MLDIYIKRSQYTYHFYLWAKLCWLQVVEAADVVLEVLDSRDPLGSRCQELESIVRASANKKLVLILNKIGMGYLCVCVCLTRIKTHVSLCTGFVWSLKVFESLWKMSSHFQGLESLWKMNNSAEVFESRWILTSPVCWLFGNEQKSKSLSNLIPEDASAVRLV